MEADIRTIADVTHRSPGMSTISECDMHCPARNPDS